MKEGRRRRIEREILQKRTGMRHCKECDQFKTDDDFPAPGSIICSRCASTISRTQSRLNPDLDFRGLKIEKKGDDFIIEKSDDPNAMPSLAGEITDRIDADVLGDRGANSPDYVRNGDLNIRTQRATRHDDSVAHRLLNIAGYKSHVGPMAPPINVTEEAVKLVDDRTLIDRLHEATFTEPVGLQWIEDKYALRTLVRKAHCFTLDKVTSSLVGDFSLAIASDLEAARRMAIPPFPVTWIDVDNRARLSRMKELGVGLTANAETDAVHRVGWLIHPDVANGGHFAHYVCQVDEGVTISPLAYWWHCEAPNVRSHVLRDKMAEVDIMVLDRLSFGLKDSRRQPDRCRAVANTDAHRADDEHHEVSRNRLGS